jgi:hypothetical protein
MAAARLVAPKRATVEYNVISQGLLVQSVEEEVSCRSTIDGRRIRCNS